MARGSAARRRMRWAVPAGAVAVVAAIIAGTAVAGAQAAPSLPARTPAQLIAAVAAARPVALTGTITETVNLGLPALPSGDQAGAAGPLSGLSLLSGTHTFMLWYADPQHIRIAEPVQLGESDVRRSGRQVWLWDSRTQTATHLTLPAPGARPGPRAHPAVPRTPPTPQQAARQILAALGKTTVVSVPPAVTIAGRPAYQLGLAPRAGGSLIGQVTVAIDAATSLPLRVQVFAKGASAPALSIGYTALTLGRPAASNFTFTPPPGATVKTQTLPAPGFHGFLPGAGPAAGLGMGGLPAPIPVPALGPGQPLGPGPRSRPRIIKPVPSGPGAGTAAPAGPGLPGPRPRTLGTGWLSVLVIPPPGGVTAFFSNPVHVLGHTASAAGSSAGTASAVIVSPGPSASPGILPDLLKAATPVQGPWGSGRLLRTSLLSVLRLSDGTLLIGAVTPAVLFADAATLR